MKIFGLSVKKAELFSFHVDFPLILENVDFAPVVAEVPLPDLEWSVEATPDGGLQRALVHLTNAGEKALRLFPVEVPGILAGLELDIDIAPGAMVDLPMSIANVAALEDFSGGELWFATTDPDTPTLAITINGDGNVEASGDLIGGCSTGGNVPTGALPVLLALWAMVGWRSRRV